MRRKRIIKLPTPETMSIADALVVMQQTITVTMVLQRGIDPNEAYNEWEANKGNILACVQIIQRILETAGEELDLLQLHIPDGLGLGGYNVQDLDLDGKRDELPF